MIILDACVLIAHLDANDTHHGRAVELLRSVEAESFAASAVSIAEVLVGPARSGRLDEGLAALGRLDVATVAFDDGFSARLALLRAESELKLPDCCVLDAAEQNKASLGTFDDRLATASRGRGLHVYTR